MIMIMIIDLSVKTGRVEPTLPKVCGHRGPITDIQWNPFDDDVIASSSEDALVSKQVTKTVHCTQCTASHCVVNMS